MIASMLMIALVLIGVQTHALFMSGAASGADRPRALKASVIETLNPLYGRPQPDDEPTPFDREAPDMSIH